MMMSKTKEALLPTTTASPEAEHLLSREDADSSLSAPTTNPWSGYVNGLYSGVSNLSNLLPTGTFLAFTALAPIVTDNGTCDDHFEQYLTIATTVCFTIFCMFSCFTDSFQAADGQVYYGIVSLRGLWTPHVPVALRPLDKEQFKLTFIDVIHAVLAVAVFTACSLMTPNIRYCLYPRLPENVVRIVPALVGFVVSGIFVVLPSRRHGIGYPVSPASFSYTSREAAYLLQTEEESPTSVQTSTTSRTKKL